MNDADIFQSSAVIVCVWSSEAKHVLFCSVFFPQAKMVKIQTLGQWSNGIKISWVPFENLS